MIVHSSPIEHPPTPTKIVLMSGLSDPSCCALSRVQQQFLDRLTAPRETKLYANFPYVPPSRSEQLPVPLLIASWRNFSQFVGVRRSPYRDHALAHWNSLAGSCRGLLVVTISCGLEILNMCLSSGVRPPELEVLALGPVAWRRPPVTHTLIRGSHDFVVNPWFRSVDLVLPGVGHMNYLDNPNVIELVESRMQNLLTRTMAAEP
jgi:hypothetical protein